MSDLRKPSDKSHLAKDAHGQPIKRDSVTDVDVVEDNPPHDILSVNEETLLLRPRQTKTKMGKGSPNSSNARLATNQIRTSSDTKIRSEATTGSQSKPHYHGHRTRLRERFLNTNGEGLSDYELLEMMLFRSIPRRDCKPEAKALLAKFGSIAQVMVASEADLTSLSGITPNIAADLKLVHHLARRITRAEISTDKPVLDDINKVIEYCRVTMGHEPREHLRAMYLDTKNRLLGDELLSVGTAKQTAIYPREIMRKALEIHATALILAHNHPSGECKPSMADQTVTIQLADIAAKMGISLHDHIIVSRSNHLSMREAGIVTFPPASKFG